MAHQAATGGSAWRRVGGTRRERPNEEGMEETITPNRVPSPDTAQGVGSVPTSVPQDGVTLPSDVPTRRPDPCCMLCTTDVARSSPSGYRGGRHRGTCRRECASPALPGAAPVSRWGRRARRDHRGPGCHPGRASTTRTSRGASPVAREAHRCRRRRGAGLRRVCFPTTSRGPPLVVAPQAALQASPVPVGPEAHPLRGVAVDAGPGVPDALRSRRGRHGVPSAWAPVGGTACPISASVAAVPPDVRRLAGDHGGKEHGGRHAGLR